MANTPVVFWELASHDADKSAQFLKDVFDWDISYDADANFYDVPAFDAPVPGGIFTLRRARLPFLTIYIRVDDIEAMVTRVEEHGGYIVDPPIVIDSGAKICLFSEPSGVILAMYEPPKK